jgi:hypothetical protein
VSFLIVRPIFMGIGWHQFQVALRTPSPLIGAWHLDAAHQATGAFIDPKGLPITDLYVLPGNQAYSRSTDGQLWITMFNPNSKEHTVRIRCYFIGAPTNYAWQLSDPDHLVLTSVPPEAPKADSKEKSSKPAVPFKPAVLSLTRIPTPTHYPLLERGFHLVNEWRYER